MAFRFQLSVEIGSSRRLALMARHFRHKYRQLAGRAPNAIARRFSRAGSQTYSPPPSYHQGYPSPLADLNSSPTTENDHSWYEASTANEAFASVTREQSIVMSPTEEVRMTFRDCRIDEDTQIPYIIVQDYSGINVDTVDTQVDTA
ncbi:hypothetical protein BST61_g5325 [Cercospora zeina]